MVEKYLAPHTVLITGASEGIGRDLAYICAEHGHNLVITARNEARLRSLADELKQKFNTQCDIIVRDLASPSAARELFDEIKRRNTAIDILINNAGFGGHGPFVNQNLDEILGMVQVNVTGLTHLTSLFLPAMVRAAKGRIMNVASTAAFQPGPLMAVYYATKAFVLSFSEATAVELVQTGVTVTALCPGSTATEFQKRAGVADVRVIQRTMMDSMTVARAGYAAMMSGQRICIPGVRNKLLVQAVRILPRRAVTAVVKKLNQTR